MWNVLLEASSGGRGGGRELGGDGGKDPDDEVTRHICADLEEGRRYQPRETDQVRVPHCTSQCDGIPSQ